MVGSASKIRYSRLRIVAGILFCQLILCGTTAVHAQDLQVSPTGWDYGNVVVGTSETVTFNLLAGPPTAVWTFVIVLNETPDFEPPYANPSPVPSMGEPGTEPVYSPPVYSLGAFSFDPLAFPPWPLGGPIFPREMLTGEHIPVDVIFTPPSPGYYSVYLAIVSNDSIDLPGPRAFFLLEGTGVSAVVPVPGALLLAGLGAGIVGLVRRRMV